jgi:phospholipase C
MFRDISANSSSNNNDPIKHVVYLMLENHPFDGMLGDVTKIKPVEGIDANNPHFNLDYNGNKIFQKETTAVQMALDPNHEFPDVMQQLGNNNGGFVQNFILNNPNSSDADRQQVMSYYPYGFLPALHALAKEFVVCDHWHASVPGPTWTNRFFALSGTSMGRVIMVNDLKDINHIPELFYQNQKNIFDRLDEKGISWRCYCGDVPISLVLTHQRTPEKLIHYHPMGRFYEDAKGPEDQFPQFSFIEPRYLGNDQNDDHPPHNTMKTEKFVADIYNALRGNEKLWQSILFLLLYDEHGGSYDHVIPPKAVPPDDHHEEGCPFDRLGVRVPAILISPWVSKPVEHTLYDHTSPLKYFIEIWDLDGLRERTKHANSIGISLNLEGEPRQNCLQSITVSDDQLVSPKPYLEKHNVNANHELIHAFADFLNKKDKSTSIPDLPVMSRITWAWDKLGETLEHYGYLGWSEWCRKDADTYRQLRIEHTLKIVGNKLTMFQPKNKKEKETIAPAFTSAMTADLR